MRVHERNHSTVASVELRRIPRTRYASNNSKQKLAAASSTSAASKSNVVRQMIKRLSFPMISRSSIIIIIRLFTKQFMHTDFSQFVGILFWKSFRYLIIGRKKHQSVILKCRSKFSWIIFKFIIIYLIKNKFFAWFWFIFLLVLFTKVLSTNHSIFRSTCIIFNFLLSF